MVSTSLRHSSRLFRNFGRHWPPFGLRWRRVSSVASAPDLLATLRSKAKAVVEHDDKNAEALAAAKAALLEIVHAHGEADPETAYLVGVLYLKQPFDPVLATKASDHAKTEEQEGQEPSKAHTKVLNEIRQLREAAKEARRQRVRRVTQSVQEAPNNSGVLVSKSTSGQAIRAGVGDCFNAWRWLQSAAFRGHTAAMVRLGNICVENVADDRSGGAYNVGLAERWYIRAAAAPSPSPDAMYNLAKLYHEGFNIEGNTGETIQLLPRDASRARFWVFRACHYGDPTACLWIAHAARTGDAGLGFDGAERDIALSYLKQALSLGAPGVNFYAAQLHRFGDQDIGVEPNEALFWKYAKKGANVKEADALFALADAHFKGTEKVEPSFTEAFKYYGLACDAGSGEAALCLGAFFARGVGVEQDFAAALRYYELAADRGCVLAWQNIASMYALGQGVPRNEDAAKRILETWGPHIREAIEAQ